MSRSMLQPVNARAASLMSLSRVVALAEREELHHLAREVLVRLRLAVLSGVEIDEHRRILRRLVQQSAKLPSAFARSVAFCWYMSCAKRTFCSLDTKWLCQKSVMRSVIGDGVTRISSSHQARSSRPWRDQLLLEARRSSGVTVSARG